MKGDIRVKKEAELVLSHEQQKIWTRDFILICFVNFFLFLGFQMSLPTIPLFVEYLGGNEQLIGLVVGIFTFSALLIRPISGHVIETKGRRFIFLIGLILFLISVGSYTLATSLWFLFAMRIFQGAGWGLSTTAAGTVVTDLLPIKRRGEGMGYFGLSGNIAMAFGPSLALALVPIVNFQILFSICSVLVAIALVLSLFIRYKPVDKHAVSANKRKWDVYEKTALQPSLLLFFITVTFGGIASFLPLHTLEVGVKGITWYFFFFAIAVMLSRTFGGRLYDQKGIRVIFIPSALSIITGMLLLAFLAHEWMLIAAAFLYGIGYGMVQPALQAWAVNNAPADRKGMASATFFSLFDLGVGLGAMFFGFIAKYFGYGSIYLTAAISVTISILLYIIFLKKEGERIY